MRECVRVRGALTPIDIPLTEFRLQPIIAAAAERPRLTPADGEVASIVEVPVAELLDPTRRVSTTRVSEGRDRTVPAFRAGGVEIWGATAMVVAEFLVLIGWTPVT